MTRAFSESTVEDAALAWLEGTGWQVAHGPDIAPDTAGAERASYAEVVLERRLRDALARLNLNLPVEALEEAYRELTGVEGSDLVARNRKLHRLLVAGATIEYRDADGAIPGAQARALDFDDVSANDWLAVDQFTVTEKKHTRRPDVVLFVNGLPLAVLELKNAASEDATDWTAFRQIQTYKAEIPALLASNAVLVVSDGVEARAGTLTDGREWFKPWRTVSGETLADASMPQLQVTVIRGTNISDSRALFYFFRSALGRNALLERASTVGTPGIGQPLSSLRSITVPIPTLDEQRAIARILGTLDDKIELNRRMSETLEAMARALFKSWSVDFDPVRAKTEGRDPGLPKPLADLFLARSGDFREFAIQSMTGSSGRQRVPAQSLGHYWLVDFPESIAKAFRRIVEPLFGRARHAAAESGIPAGLRDTLLPKLNSGELHVRDAERFLEVTA